MPLDVTCLWLVCGITESDNAEQMVLASLGAENQSASAAVCNSKDLGHIACLSGNLHVLIPTLEATLKRKAPKVKTTIGMPCEEAAHSVYLVNLKQKNLFLQESYSIVRVNHHGYTINTDKATPTNCNQKRDLQLQTC